MESINILCLGLSKVLLGILEASFSGQRRLRLMGNVESLTEPLLSGYEQPGVIIMESPDCRICPDILYRFPRAKVVNIGRHGKSIAVWTLRPEKQDLGEISSDELAAAIVSLSGDLN